MLTIIGHTLRKNLARDADVFPLSFAIKVEDEPTVQNTSHRVSEMVDLDMSIVLSAAIDQ